MKTLVIHLSDPTTEELSLIYEGCDELGEIERVSDWIEPSELNQKIKSADTVIMLGHGTPRGLINITSKGDKPYIVDEFTVPYLRGKKVIAIWCYAREFARTTHLEGFFSSMWISEETEAQWNKIYGFEQEYIRRQCGVLSENINGLIKEGADLSTFPKRLQDADTEKNELTNFNYGGLAYYDEHTDWNQF